MAERGIPRWAGAIEASDTKLEARADLFTERGKGSFPEQTVRDVHAVLVSSGVTDPYKILTVRRLAQGMRIELEHGTRLGSVTNITHDDPLMTARIALAHLLENPLYYDYLERMEAQADAWWDEMEGRPDRIITVSPLKERLRKLRL